MADRIADELRAKVAALEARLNSSPSAADLNTLKVEIHAAYKQVELELAELNAVRDGVMRLVDRWKAVRAAAPSLAPAFTDERPVVHADHIGASTFIEKGWSKISAGEYPDAEAAL